MTRNFCVALMVFIAFCQGSALNAHAQDTANATVSQKGSPTHYPNTVDGLRQFLSDGIAAAKANDVALEVNALGLRKIAHKKASNPYPLYPWLPFWELAAECGVKVIVNSDAHRPQDLQARTGEARAIVERLGLQAVEADWVGSRRRG